MAPIALEALMSWLFTRVREDVAAQDPEYFRAGIRIIDDESPPKEIWAELLALHERCAVQAKQPWTELLTALSDYRTHMDMLAFNGECLAAAPDGRALQYYVRAQFPLARSALESLDYFVKRAGRKGVIPKQLELEQVAQLEPLLKDPNLTRGRKQVVHGAFTVEKKSWAGGPERRGLWEVAALIGEVRLDSIYSDLSQREHLSEIHFEKYLKVERAGTSVLLKVREAADAEWKRKCAPQL